MDLELGLNIITSSCRAAPRVNKYLDPAKQEAVPHFSGRMGRPFFICYLTCQALLKKVLLHLSNPAESSVDINFDAFPRIHSGSDFLGHRALNLAGLLTLARRKGRRQQQSRFVLRQPNSEIQEDQCCRHSSSKRLFRLH
jgi:hypothetical protein